MIGALKQFLQQSNEGNQEAQPIGPTKSAQSDPDLFLVICWPPWPIFQPPSDRDHNIQQSNCSGDMSKSGSKQLNLFVFSDSSNDWTVGHNALSPTSE